VLLAARRQGGEHLAAKGAIQDFYIHLDVQKHEPGDGKRGSGELKRWYKPPAGDREDALVKTWWKDAAGETTTGLARYGRRVLAWTMGGAQREPRRLGPRDAKTVKKIRAEARQTGVLLRAFLLRNLLTKGTKLEIVEKTKGHGRTSWSIRRTAEGDPPLLLWIDADTYELWGIRVEPREPGEMEWTFRFSKHRPMGDLRVPRGIQIFERSFEAARSGGKDRETTRAYVLGLEFNEGRSEAFFEKP
jgi:hypothetical protein